MALSASLPPGARDGLDRAAMRWPGYALAAVGLAALPFGDLPRVVEFAPFVLSLLVFGLPHGAVDHLVPSRVAGTPLARSLAAVGAVYAVLMAAYYAVWVLAPAAAFVGFVLLTWFHWGQGDVYALLRFTGAEHLPSRAERALAVVVRGGLPMLVPLVGHPGEYRRVAAALVGLFRPGAVAALAPLFRVETRAALGAGFLAVSVLALGLGYRRVRRGADAAAWRRDALEVALLWLYFLATPPILAVGLYFCLWHAVRHVGRLALVDDGSVAALSARDLRGAVRRFARDAAPLTLGGLLVVAGVAVAVPRPPGDSDALLGAYLVAIAALTLPHVVVVTWMDLRQGVW